ncbi:SDR family oxidoreductase [Bergeyella sp. RCAD1439]|uniref:SDR family oxidoreductase n=1 Tax=Bergeyella anatis TaxID=3113737 RepID=UPI002E17F4A2|nr:SDR family oxidoreductase [Bergeyella sp. RCAD1439]
MEFKYKRVLITGGASGIGKIMARKVLERGCSDLVIWDIDKTGLDRAVAEMASLGGRAHGDVVDVACPDSVEGAARRVLSEVGGIDVLINNAGVVVGSYFHEHTFEQMEKSLRVNTLAPMLVSQMFLPGMMERNCGAVCNIASSAGLVSNPKMSVYAASKWAAVGWSDSLRLEMEHLGNAVSVTTVMPYYINTGMFEGVRSKRIPILEPERASERILRAVEREQKLVAFPLPYGLVRFFQGILPLPLYDWVMRHVLGIYETMDGFKGRG